MDKDVKAFLFEAARDHEEKFMLSRYAIDGDEPDYLEVAKEQAMFNALYEVIEEIGCEEEYEEWTNER